MEYYDLFRKVKSEEKDLTKAQNLAYALFRAPSELKPVIEAWVGGQEPEYSFQGVTLTAIRDKEHCSDLRALLRMQTLMENPELAAGYLHWRPINKDWGR